jgi:exosome complex RNA-binding protein Rrp4
MIKVDWKLIKRVKKHFIEVKKINVILGHNGHIWLSYDEEKTEKSEISDALYRISMLSNIIRLLNNESIIISIDNIETVYDYAHQLKLHSKYYNQLIIL